MQPLHAQATQPPSTTLRLALGQVEQLQGKERVCQFDTPGPSAQSEHRRNVSLFRPRGRAGDAVYLAAADGWLRLLTVEHNGVEIPASTLKLPGRIVQPSLLSGRAVGLPPYRAQNARAQASIPCCDPLQLVNPVRYSFICGDTASKVWMSGDEYRILLDAKRSSHAMTLIDALVPPSGGPPIHSHDDADELFIILEGTLDFTVDGQTRAVQAGDCVFVARTVPHAFFNSGSQPARMLLVYTPAGAEAFFLAAGLPVAEGAARPSADEASRAREIAAAGLHGITQAAPALMRATSFADEGGK